MNDRNLLIASGMLGAITGVAAGYLLLTDEGRRWRAQAEGSLSTFIQEAERLLSAADQVRQSVADIRGGSQSGYPRSA